MSEVLAELPAALREAVAGGASRRGVSEAAWFEEAVREKLAADAELAYLAVRGVRADRAAYEAALDRAPAAAPDPGDER